VYLKKPRLTKDEYYLNIAKEVAVRSTCLRSKYGSLIVKRDRIKAEGYNGAPRDTPNCCDLGHCSRDVSGTRRYNNCRGLHAESNALQFCNEEDAYESTMYIARIPTDDSTMLTVTPCPDCRRRILQGVVKRVVCLQNDGTILEFNPRDWINEL
jgi:dCMP deaminase